MDFFPNNERERRPIACSGEQKKTGGLCAAGGRPVPREQAVTSHALPDYGHSATAVHGGRAGELPGDQRAGTELQGACGDI